MAQIVVDVFEVMHWGVGKVSHLPALQFSHKGKLQRAENISAVKWLQKLGNEAAEFAAVCIVECRWPLVAFQEGFNAIILL